MASNPDLRAVARDAHWLAHRYEPGRDAIHFLKLSRDDHRAVTFVTEEYLSADLPREVLPRGEAVATAAGTAAPIHFIFHSAFCCSTLLARAFDIPGVSMGLKEPTILNDLSGWRYQRPEPRFVAQVLDGVLGLLARPLGSGEAVVVKPSNVLSGLYRAMLAMRPDARALLLYAPLDVYLGSIAKKGLDGRLWVRDLFLKLRREGMIERLGFDDEALFGQTDLQIAAAGWLIQHALFADLAAQFGDRVRTLDSELLVARPEAAMKALAAHYRLQVSDTQREQIVAEVFSRHGKLDQAFNRDTRIAEQRAAAEAHRDELEKVKAWAEAVAGSAGIALDPPNPLIAQ